MPLIILNFIFVKTGFIIFLVPRNGWVPPSTALWPYFR